MTAVAPVDNRRDIVSEELNPLANAHRQLEIVAERIEIDPDRHEILKHPKRTVTVSIPTRMDNGSVRIFHGVSGAPLSAAGTGQRGRRVRSERDVNRRARAHDEKADKRTDGRAGSGQGHSRAVARVDEAMQVRGLYP